MVLQSWTYQYGVIIVDRDAVLSYHVDITHVTSYVIRSVSVANVHDPHQLDSVHVVKVHMTIYHVQRKFLAVGTHVRNR